MQHVDAYAEYRRIVGDDDGGTPFTEEAYQRQSCQNGVSRIR